MANMFLRLQGPDGVIKGESTDVARGGERTHDDEIELLGWEWQIKNDAALGVKPAGAAKKTQSVKLSVTKGVDLASTTLMQFCTLGTMIDKATLTCRKNLGEEK